MGSTGWVSMIPAPPIAVVDIRGHRIDMYAGGMSIIYSPDGEYLGAYPTMGEAIEAVIQLPRKVIGR